MRSTPYGHERWDFQQFKQRTLKICFKGMVRIRELANRQKSSQERISKLEDCVAAISKELAVLREERHIERQRQATDNREQHRRWVETNQELDARVAELAVAIESHVGKLSKGAKRHSKVFKTTNKLVRAVARLQRRAAPRTSDMSAAEDLRTNSAILEEIDKAQTLLSQSLDSRSESDANISAVPD